MGHSQACDQPEEWIVSTEESGNKLLTFILQRSSNGYSARFLKRIIEQNGCQVNGRVERFASALVGRGDHIRLFLNLPSSRSAQVFQPARLLYEDEALLIYNKPAGINSDEKGILSLLAAYAPSLHLVHRLDRETTGVLVCAKQSAAAASLEEQFKQRLVQKCYRAIVDGQLLEPEGVIENFLGKKSAYAGQTLWQVMPKGLYAYTEWCLLKSGDLASLVQCFPKTGRTHQLRVHLAHLGHPIVGDVQYGTRLQSAVHSSRYFLHAERLSFHHPFTHRQLCLEAPLPEDFQHMEKKLFGTSHSIT